MLCSRDAVMVRDEDEGEEVRVQSASLLIDEESGPDIDVRLCVACLGSSRSVVLLLCLYCVTSLLSLLQMDPARLLSRSMDDGEGVPADWTGRAMAELSG